ncbi:MAG: hypothetical protein JWO87_1438, partial [Phycisphaerales bacterium]|nr:hypothetical protein [Phycisphaerales bacterium]
MTARAWSEAIRQGALGAAVVLGLTLPITICLSAMGIAWVFVPIIAFPATAVGFLTGLGAFRRESERHRRVNRMCV